MRTLPSIRSSRRRFGAVMLSLVPPFAALAIQFASWGLLSPYAWMTFYPAIILSAWLGGLRQGLIATVVSTIGVWWFFVPPEHVLWKGGAHLVPAAIFLGLGAVVSAFLGRLKKVNVELRQANEERSLFTALVEASPDFIGFADPQFRPRYINPAGRRMVGLAADAPLENLSIFDFYAPDQRAKVEAGFETASRQRHMESETRMRNFADDSTFPVSLARFAIDNPKTGARLGIGTVTRNISGAKQLERSLRDLTSDLERAQAVAGVGSWRADLPAEVRAWSRETYRILGIDPTTAPSTALFYSKVHPDDLGFVQQRWAAAVAGAPYDVEHRIVVAGETRWVRAKAELIRSTDREPVAVIGTLQEITAEKRRETGQRVLVELATVLSESLDYERILAKLADLLVRELADFCVVDALGPDGALARVRVTCRNPANEWVCTTLAKVALGQGQPFLAADAIATRRSTFMPEVSQAALTAMAQDEDHLRALRGLDARSLIVVPLFAAGSLLGTIALVASRSSAAYSLADLRFAEELAHRAALSIENARLYRAAQDAIRSRDEVLGVVAHDLRNPLNAITLQATVVHDKGPSLHEPANAISRAARRMNRMIEDLLDVTSMEVGQFSIQRSLVPCVQLIRDFAEAQAQLAAAAKLELKVEVAADIPSVSADRDRLLQVLENLIGNAIKFTHHGGRITIGAARQDGEVLFWVADTGVGISPEDQTHVFDRFWRGTRSRARGAGLGLAISKGIIEAHGGRIWVESQPGIGTTMRFTIPAVASVDRHEPRFRDLARDTPEKHN